MNAAKTIKSIWSFPTRQPSEHEAVVQAQAELRSNITDTPSQANRRTELPPPGPSNIIVLGANPLPAPKDVRSQ